MDDEKGLKITRRWLDKLKPEDGSEHGTRYADHDLPGFFITVYATGRAVFAVRYRVHGQRRSVKLGDYPATMPEDARKEALAALGGAAKGEDEAAKRKAAREGASASAKRITFGKWREEYVRDAARRLKSTRDPERYLAMAGKEWDARPLEEITVRDVETLRNRIAEKGTTQANRWLANVRPAFTHALRLGHVEKNPAALVRLLPENAPSTRTLSETEEKRFREVLAKWPDLFGRVAFTLLLDTGARLSEVLRARWEDFDLDEKTHAGTWRIPSPKAGRPQAVPILPHVGKVVAGTPQPEGEDDSPFLVPGRNAFVHRSDLKGPWDALKTAAKLGDDVHIHDLRRSFGLRVTLSQGIFAASKLLRHSDSRVTEKVYAPLAPEDVRGFADATERARILSFNKRKRKVSKE